MPPGPVPTSLHVPFPQRTLHADGARLEYPGVVDTLTDESAHGPQGLNDTEG